MLSMTHTGPPAQSGVLHLAEIATHNIDPVPHEYIEGPGRHIWKLAQHLVRTERSELREYHS